MSDVHSCVSKKPQTKCGSRPFEVNGELEIGIRISPMIRSTGLSQSLTPLESRQVFPLAPAVFGPRKLVTLAQHKCKCINPHIDPTPSPGSCEIF